jgi:hypothetical protein
MKRIAVALCFLSTTCFAQTQEYTIKLTTVEIDIVGKGLGELPYKDVALLLQKLREQIIAQQKAVDEKK